MEIIKLIKWIYVSIILNIFAYVHIRGIIFMMVINKNYAQSYIFLFRENFPLY